MLKLNRKTEYALLALHFMSRHEEGRVASVRAIAQHYAIPEMILAKVLQRLKHGGFVSSVKGSSGGYGLSRPMETVSLRDVFSLFDEQTNLVDCIEVGESCECVQEDHCDIRRPMEALNALILGHLEGLSLRDFFAADLHQARPRNLAIFRR